MDVRKNSMQALTYEIIFFPKKNYYNKNTNNCCM